MIDCEPGGTVGGGEDGVGSAETDVGLVHIVEHGLVDPETTRQRMDQLRAESCRLDSNQYLYGRTADLRGELTLLV